LMQNNLIDEIQAYIAPMVIGRGLGAFSHLEYDKLDEITHWELKKILQIENDLKLIFIKEYLKDQT